MHCQWGGNPKTAPAAWDFVTLPEEDRATVIGNMHKKFSTDRACGSGNILADRQSDRQRDRQTEVLITILAAGEVTNTTTTTTTALRSFYSATTRVSRCQKRTSGLYGARED